MESSQNSNTKCIRNKCTLCLISISSAMFIILCWALSYTPLFMTPGEQWNYILSNSGLMHKVNRIWYRKNSSSLRQPMVDFCLEAHPCNFTMLAHWEVEQNSSNNALIHLPSVHLLDGSIIFNQKNETFHITLQNISRPIIVTDTNGPNKYNELLLFNNQLLTFDSILGTIYEIALPYSVLVQRHTISQSTVSPKAMRVEWATVKHNMLWIGSSGNDAPNHDYSSIQDNSNMIAVVDNNGKIMHLNWSKIYDLLKTVKKLHSKGSIVHRAISWSSHLNKWVIISQYMSSDKISEIKSEMTHGANIILLATEDFSQIEINYLGTPNPFKRISAFKFIPGTKDKFILAINQVKEPFKYEKNYLTIFKTTTGEIIVEDVEIAHSAELEGLEFLPKNLVSK